MLELQLEQHRESAASMGRHYQEVVAQPSAGEPVGMDSRETPVAPSAAGLMGVVALSAAPPLPLGKGPSVGVRVGETMSPSGWSIAGSAGTTRVVVIDPKAPLLRL